MNLIILSYMGFGLVAAVRTYGQMKTDVLENGRTFTTLEQIVFPLMGFALWPLSVLWGIRRGLAARNDHDDTGN